MRILGTEHYDIIIGSVKPRLGQFLSGIEGEKCIVIVDEHTRKDCLPILEQYAQRELDVVEIRSGEVHKNIETCQGIWTQMMSMELSRKSWVINLGGGVIGDMGGFCASTFKRGIRFIQVPTTLLSQVDASVGGKLGIDFQGVKNSIGLFNDPEAVFIDPVFLQTLPEREIRSGFAEIIKHALIADADDWAMLSRKTSLADIEWEDIIYRSVGVKHRIVVEDPYEQGIRKALNFGHTIGHAIESVFLETAEPLLHGEAIAIGMICEAFISNQKTDFPTASLKDISERIIQWYGKVNLPLEKMGAMIGLMKNDKKNEGSAINFSLLPKIGGVQVNQTASITMIRESLDYYQSLT